METARYETVVRPLKRERDFVETAQECLKYHIVAVLGLQIILESEITPGNVNDTTMLPPMLDEMGRQCLSPGLPVFHADRGYDSNYNCQILFEMGITPNIKQRGGSVNRGKPCRSRGAKVFDEEEYHQRWMIGGVFGGEESKRHQLHCRFILPDNRRRFGKIRAITWNIKVLNRLMCARMRGIEISSYGTVPCVRPYGSECSAGKTAVEHMRTRSDGITQQPRFGLVVYAPGRNYDHLFLMQCGVTFDPNYSCPQHLEYERLQCK